MDEVAGRRPVVALTGATGFIGRAFAKQFSQQYRVVGLSRSPRRVTEDGPSEWRRCDLYSIGAIEEALAGCDTAIYLVHSMSPSARMTQASFEDLDLILADNFARGAAAAGVKHIVYVGGLLPDSGGLSKHLASRREVEEALAAHGAKVTTLRAGLVVGAGGSSFQILERLVGRLPVMLCPAWTQTEAQPIAVEDVCALMGCCIDDPALAGQTWDIGGPQRTTYRKMIGDVARLMGKRRLLLRVPFFSPWLSRLWVSLVTSTPRALVYPLVESLEHPMVAHDRELQRRTGIDGTPWKDAAAKALRPATPVALLDRPLARRSFRSQRTVRSVQRLPRPAGASAQEVAEEYLRWLPRFMRPLLRSERDGPTVAIIARFLRRPLLVLRFIEERSSEDRAKFHVVGGLLAANTPRPGRLEFRIAPDQRTLLAAIHDFVPALPWYLYVLTQAIAHLFVMRRFGAHLSGPRALAAAQRSLPASPPH